MYTEEAFEITRGNTKSIDVNGRKIHYTVSDFADDTVVVTDSEMKWIKIQNQCKDNLHQYIWNNLIMK